MSKLPYFPFYPGDWQKDPNLRRCSHAAKGVLMDALCFAFELEERGVFVSGGRPWSEKELAEAVGGNLDVAFASISELLSKGVLKRRSDGAIYSARMVKDESTRQKRSDCGRKGGNPILLNRKVNHLDNTPLKPPLNMIYEDKEGLKGEAPNTEQQTECYEKARVVLGYLNQKTGGDYKESASCLDPIAERMFETSLDVEGCKLMINRFVALWKDDPKMEQCLKPQTLFGEKFHGYYGQRNMPLPSGKASSIHDLRAALSLKEARITELKRKHYSETQSLIGGKHYPAGWRDEQARQECVELNSEAKELRQKIARAS